MSWRPVVPSQLGPIRNASDGDNRPGGGDLRIGNSIVAKLEPCLQTALSPDGATLACFDSDFRLSLLDVRTGAEQVAREEFYPRGAGKHSWAFSRALGRRDVVAMAFSPDARRFAAGCFDQTFAWDLETRREIPVGKEVRGVLGRGFTFVGPGRIAGSHLDDPEKSGLVAFPEGGPVERVTLADQALAASPCGRFHLVRPAGKHPVAAMRLADKKFFLANRTRALDLHGERFVSERATGEIALYRVDAPEKPAAAVKLPTSPLAGLREARFSSDLEWLILSGRGHGGVWRVSDGKRVLASLGFSDGDVDAGGGVVLDFPPRDDDEERRIGRGHLLGGGGLELAQAGERRLTLAGPYLLERGGMKAPSIDVLDARDERRLWSRRFEGEMPKVWATPPHEAIVFEWSVKSDHVARRLRSDAALAARRRRVDDRASFLEVVDAGTGDDRGSVLVDPGMGERNVRHAIAAGGHVVVSDRKDRIHVYRLDEDAPLHREFGRRPVAAAGVLAYLDAAGRLVVRDLESFEERHSDHSAP